MLTVHAPTATTFTATGEGVLDPELIDARVIEELGGAYQLTVTYPADGPLASKLAVEAIIAAPVPGTTIRQGFRIHEVTTSLDRLLEVTAFHLFYDLAGNFIADTFVVNKTPRQPSISSLVPRPRSTGSPRPAPMRPPGRLRVWCG